MRSIFVLFMMHIFNLVFTDPTLASLKNSKISISKLQRDRTLLACNCLGNRLRGGSGGVGLESGRNEMIKRARSFELLRTKSFGELSTLEYEALIKNLFSAAERGDMAECTKLIKQGAWPNHILLGDPLQVNALHIAAINGHAALCRQMVELGADVHMANRYGYTALHLASQLGHIDAVRALLEVGADPAAEDGLGDTPVDRARLAGCDAVAALLDSVVAGDSCSMLRSRQRWRREWAPRRVDRSHFLPGLHENPMLENL
uniref:Uncharacterized protein n=1 Tax=Cryptomonas curvata TaxID=233186 RepID=A0A7S0LZ38_9CRYP|mmetsp:Transcript_17124/g.36183  ORF Transcript_17124/g.36183 Transcript_17124/m.36183 type:complete len:260 (+) Transcript_17124:73-852(+)